MKLVYTVLASTVLLTLWVPALRAQSTQGPKQDSGPVTPDSPLPPMGVTPEVRSGQTPAPAARGVSSARDSQPYDPAQVEPDTHTLSGAELFSVGSLGKSRTIFDPSLFFTEVGTGAPFLAPTQTTFMSSTQFGGTLAVDQTWGISRLVALYNGGYTISSPKYVPDSYYHDLSIEDEITWARLKLRIRDDLQVTPYAYFGGQGTGGPGLIGQFNPSSQTALSSTIVNGQTIQTALAMRLMDTAVGEVDYSFSRRSTVSFSGTYGLLHFMDPGFIDSHSINVQGGFDHMLDPRNSIAVIGSYGKTDFVGFPNSNSDYIGELAYGRRITGKLALQVAAGPEHVQVPVPGSSDVQFLTWTTNAKISYQTRRTTYSLYYTHGLTNGSGVLQGALSHTFSGSLTHSLTRYWSGSVNGGYALDRSIAIPTSATSFSFTNWFAGAYVGRRLGNHMNINFNYGLTHSSTNSACPFFVCGYGGYFHTFGTTVDWHLRRME